MMPQYMLSAIHPPGEVYLQEVYDWRSPLEWRFSYGNNSSSSKIIACQRIGAPITVISWMLKRYNNKYGSIQSNAEGSLRLLCRMCHPFQTQSPNPSPHIGLQGCGTCIMKLNLVDTTLLVRILFTFYPL